MSVGADVVAAGAVVTRRGGREVLLVHRPKYDDWSYPKGKQNLGEHITTTAVREVLEETGVAIELGRPLLPQFYEVASARSKVVNYWVARPRRDLDEDSDPVKDFTPNREIDALQWFTTSAARAKLTYLDDIELLDQLEATPKRTAPLIVLRHAHARSRSSWTNADPLRPLARAGRREADGLIEILTSYAVSRIISSPSIRCLETVSPYAEAAEVKIEEEPAFSEEGDDSAAQSAVFANLMESSEPTLVCSHRPVLPGLFELLGITEEPLAPGEMVVCHHRKGRLIAVERHHPVA